MGEVKRTDAWDGLNRRKNLIRVYSLVSMPRERRRGMDKEITVVWLEDASSTYISVYICVHSLVSCFKASIGTLVGIIDRRQPTV